MRYNSKKEVREVEAKNYRIGHSLADFAST